MFYKLAVAISQIYKGRWHHCSKSDYDWCQACPSVNPQNQPSGLPHGAVPSNHCGDFIGQLVNRSEDNKATICNHHFSVLRHTLMLNPICNIDIEFLYVKTHKCFAYCLTEVDRSEQVLIFPIYYFIIISFDQFNLFYTNVYQEVNFTDDYQTYFNYPCFFLMYLVDRATFTFINLILSQNTLFLFHLVHFTFCYECLSRG